MSKEIGKEERQIKEKQKRGARTNKAGLSGGGGGGAKM
jgi:hypothetical protein